MNAGRKHFRSRQISNVVCALKDNVRIGPVLDSYIEIWADYLLLMS